MSKIELVRTIGSDGWISLHQYLIDENSNKIFTSRSIYIAGYENNLISHNIDNFLRGCHLEYMKTEVLEAFYQLRENHQRDGNPESVEINLVPKPKPDTHVSCKQKHNEDITNQPSAENIISQSELKQELVKVDKDSNTIKLFVENKCSVCLSNYTEILDNDFHIVIPTCGHPLCCECADKILMSRKKECPRCRVNITVGSFNLMKFNAELEVETQDQKVFL